MDPSGTLPPVSNEGPGPVRPVRRSRDQARPMLGNGRSPSGAGRWAAASTCLHCSMRCSQAWVTSPLGAADARRSSELPVLAFLLLGDVIVGTTSLPRLRLLFDPAVSGDFLALARCI